MSDLETRLTEVLHAEAEHAPSAVGLASAARSRSRARRRTAAVAACAAAVAVLAVPVAVVALGGSDGDDGKTPVAPDVNPVASGRVETWHDVSVTVPDTWVNGAMGGWCANDGSVTPPRVSRPGAVVPLIGCTPTNTYGVEFSDFPGDADIEKIDWPVVGQHNDAWPDGAYVGVRSLGDVVVTVATKDVETAHAVLDSMTKVDDIDANGCPIGDDPSVVGIPGALSVCRYTGDGELEQSERLSAEDAASALSAVSAADVIPYAPECPAPESEPSPVSHYVVLLSEDTRYQVVWEGSKCPDWGVFVNAQERRELTAAVLYWALSPGFSGGFDGGVPMPDDLRAQDDH